MFEKFLKREESSREPHVQGEDFDIFPDVGGKYAYAKKESETQDDIDNEADDTPAELTDFQKKVADIPEDRWKRLQILIGVPAGLIAALSISFFGFLSDFFMSWGIVVAAGIVILLPSLFEKQSLRKLPYFRRATLFAIIAVFAFYILYIFVINPEAKNLLQRT